MWDTIESKLFPIEYTHHDTNQIDKVREQKLKREAAIICELKLKYDCWLREHWEGGGAKYQHCKYQISFS